MRDGSTGPPQSHDRRVIRGRNICGQVVQLVAPGALIWSRAAAQVQKYLQLHS